MSTRLGRLIITMGVTAAAAALTLPANAVAAAGPLPSDLLCDTLGTCPAEPDDDIVVVVDPIDVGGTVGEVVDTAIDTVDTAVPGTADALDGLPVEQLPQPVGAVLGGTTSGYAEPTLDGVVEVAQAGVNGALDDVTDVVDETLNQIGLGSVITADAHVPVDLTDGVVVSPTADASVDLGGATAPLPGPLTELVDADVAVSLCGVNIVVLTDHSQDCTGTGPAAATLDHPLLADVKLPVDVCGVQVVVLGASNVDCSTSGGNQSGGATESFADALAHVGAAVGLCGTQVGVLASAHTDCTGRPTGTDSAVCTTGAECVALAGIDTLCGINVAVPSDVTVTCAAQQGPGAPGGDPGETPGGDPGDTPEGIGNPSPGDTGDTPEGVGGMPPDGGAGGSPGGTSTPGVTPPAGNDGVFGSLPLTGVSIVSLLVAGAALSVVGLLATRTRRIAALR